MAGSGGKMAEIRQELRTKKLKRKTGGTTDDAAREEVGRRQKRASKKKTAHTDGAERLRQAADRRVGRNANKLANLLTEKALAGSLADTKVLVALAERKKPAPKPERPRRPILPWTAAELEAQPQWEGPPPEEDVALGRWVWEDGMGNRKYFGNRE